MAANNLRPNALTRETMEKSARGEELRQAKDAKELFEQLGIDLALDENCELLDPVSVRC
jgi:hypothetical protein